MSILYSYNLKEIYNHINKENTDFETFFTNLQNSVYDDKLNEIYIEHKKQSYNNNEYNIFTYNKHKVMKDDIDHSHLNYGLFRSIITLNNKIVSFGIPKSISYDMYTSLYNEDETIAERFIDGTMIQLFWTGDEWEIATRRNVGGNVKFFLTGRLDHDKTFRQMYMDILSNNENKEWLNKLNKKYCYSFVLQHTSNRIVTPIQNSSLWLVSVYHIHDDNITIDRMNIDNDMKTSFPKHIRYIEEIQFKNYNELIHKYSNKTTPYYIPGVMITNKKNGIRSKIRNPNYNMVKELRGNEPKLQYRYFTLKQNKEIHRYLYFMPEHKELFDLYHKQFQIFSNQLYTYYVECYILKKSPLKTFPFEYRTHMFKLHEYYLNHLKPSNHSITRYIVTGYLNKLHPAKLMFSLNYCFRNNQIN